MANKYIVSRKITLIPVAPLNNQWQKRFDKYINLSFERVQEQIIEAQAEIDDEETKKQEKIVYQNGLTLFIKKRTCTVITYLKEKLQRLSSMTMYIHLCGMPVKLSPGIKI